MLHDARISLPPPPPPTQASLRPTSNRSTRQQHPGMQTQGMARRHCPRHLQLQLIRRRAARCMASLRRDHRSAPASPPSKGRRSTRLGHHDASSLPPSKGSLQPAPNAAKFGRTPRTLNGRSGRPTQTTTRPPPTTRPSRRRRPRLRHRRRHCQRIYSHFSLRSRRHTPASCHCFHV